MSDTLQFHWSEAEPLQVRVRVSHRAKYMRLRVLPSGTVEAVVPPGFDRRRIFPFVEQQRGWLERNLRRIHRVEGLGRPLEPPSEIELRALDGLWTVHYQPADGGRSRLQDRGDGGLLVTADGEEWRPVLHRWLARAGNEYLIPWLERVSRDVELHFAGAVIRGQKTRWGSCSSRKVINLNYRLLFLPPPLVRYLFIHELSHTVHMNHSPRFWGLVAELEPGYEALDRQLRRASALVPRWAQAE